VPSSAARTRLVIVISIFTGASPCGFGQRFTSQLVLLSPATASAPPAASAATDARHPAGADPVSAQLWLSAHSCTAGSAGHPLQPPDGLSAPQTPGLAGLTPHSALAMLSPATFYQQSLTASQTKTT
jgi:hypothetical protein